MNAVDTNIFIYALDVADTVRGPKVLALLDRLDESDTIMPWQVACEVGAVVTRLVKAGRLPAVAHDAIATVRQRFPIVLPSHGMLQRGLDIHRVHQVSYWDSLLIVDSYLKDFRQHLPC